MFISNQYEKELIALASIISRKSKEKKIVFAPAGLETIRLINSLKFLGVSPNYIYDDNVKLENHLVEGIRIVNVNHIELIQKAYIVICSTTFMEIMSNTFEKIGVTPENIYKSYSLLLSQFLSVDEIENISDLLYENRNRIAHGYGSLADDLSRESFIRRIEYMNTPTMKTRIVKNLDSKHKFFRYQDNESVLDGGAFDGGFMEEFFATVENRFDNYYAIEPNKDNFDVLISRSLDPRVQYYNTGLCCNNAYYEQTSGMMQTSIYKYSGNSGKGKIKFHSIDNLFSNNSITLLKLNINGYEKEALCGAKKTIRCSSPKLMISCYYHVMDFVDIPYWISMNYPEYSIYLRDCSNTIFDMVLFARSE